MQSQKTTTVKPPPKDDKSSSEKPASSSEKPASSSEKPTTSSEKSPGGDDGGEGGIPKAPQTNSFLSNDQEMTMNDAEDSYYDSPRLHKRFASLLVNAW